MSLQTLRYTHFTGILQSAPESMLPLHASPLAYNIDTERGWLRTASGYVAVVPAIPSGQLPLRLFRWQKTDGSANWLVCTSTNILVYHVGTGAWQSVYNFPQALYLPGQISFLRLKIGSAEKLLIANPHGQMQLWDGQSTAVTPFGSAVQLSDMPQNYAALYFGRLFCAGDPAHPARLYWSQVPGGTRSVEDWRADGASPDAGGGHNEIGGDAEPITGLFALSNQLVILKNEKVYRLVGDRPSNYRVILGIRACPSYPIPPVPPWATDSFFWPARDSIVTTGRVSPAPCTRTHWCIPSASAALTSVSRRVARANSGSPCSRKSTGLTRSPTCMTRGGPRGWNGRAMVARTM
ncbi:MAG: hypothetical protein FWF10_01755 [Clostridiales bacterium]|nr:hypothetical protein [Clostridiales bacterium]